MVRWLVFLVGCAASAPTAANPVTLASKGSCDAPERRELDFWVGDWDLVVRARAGSSSAEWQEARGQNHIRSTFGGCVIEESFTADGPGTRWAGSSVSQWLPGERRWRQTWVDDQGSYLTFVGGRVGSDFVLADGNRRMVF